LIWIGLFFTCSFFTSFLIYRLVHPVWFLTLIGLANSVVILLDLWRGSPWMKRSFLGYDPLIGARFYGLGNEYAGILLGSSLLAVTGLCVYLNRRGIQFKKGNKIMLVALVSLFYVIIIYSMASPQLGTNAGATIAALFTYALSLFLLFRLRISWTILVPLFGLVSVYVAYLVHLHLTGEQTHIGLFIEAIRTGDLEWVAEILYRKLAMNWRLIKVSLWGKLFTTALVVMGLIYLRLYRDPFHKRKFGQQDVWMTGFKVMIVGALSILLVNDSGVVAAATTVIYMTFPFIFLRFDRHLLKTAPSSKGLA
jgi:hypothetical protein